MWENLVQLNVDDYRDVFCICSLQKMYNVRINTGKNFLVCCRKHNVDDLLLLVVLMKTFIHRKYTVDIDRIQVCTKEQ